MYCSVHQENQDVMGEAARSAYEKMFDMLDLAEQSGILSHNAAWQISSGEIAIHPYRDRTMRLVRGKQSIFLYYYFREKARKYGKDVIK